jgi:hypothetical protein
MILATLTEEQIVRQIIAVSPVLQAALDDAAIKEVIDTIGTQAGISKELLPLLEMLVSLVFTGLLRPNLMAGEIEEMFKLTTPAAMAMVARIQLEVLNVFKAELDALYSLKPIPSTATSSSTLNLKPTPSRPAPLPQGNTVVIPKTTQGSEVPAAIPNIPSGPISNSVPKPFILQKETSAEAIVKNSKFKLDLDPKLFDHAATMPSAVTVPAPPRVRPAELELGKAGEKKEIPSTPKVSVAPVARVIHYTDVQSSLGVAPAPAIKPVSPTPIMAAPAVNPVKPEVKTVPTPIAPSPSFYSKPAPLPASLTKDPAQTTFIKNSPGVARLIPPAPQSTSNKNSAPAPQSATTPPKPPRVVNFTSEEGGVK